MLLHRSRTSKIPSYSYADKMRVILVNSLIFVQAKIKDILKETAGKAIVTLSAAQRAIRKKRTWVHLSCHCGKNCFTVVCFYIRDRISFIEHTCIFGIRLSTHTFPPRYATASCNIHVFARTTRVLTLEICRVWFCMFCMSNVAMCWKSSKKVRCSLYVANSDEQWRTVTASNEHVGEK